MHPFRSMSMGSLRSSNQYPPNNSQQLMYTNSTFTNRLDNKIAYNSNTTATTSNLSAYYGNQPMPMYNNNNNNNTNNGFPPLPSPSSMTSAPNTPMLSPVRQSFPQQPQNRHYSISSTSSNSMRYNNNRASFEIDAIENSNNNSNNSNYRMQSSVHPHMIPEVNIYNNDSRLKTEISTTNNNNTNNNNNNTTTAATTSTSTAAEFSPSPNIGQLLNPVHPLNTQQIKQEQQSQQQPQQQQQQQFFMNNNSYQEYNNSSSSSRPSSFDGTKLPSVQENETNANNNIYGGNYYVQRTQQQQQPLTNTHSISVNHVNPMYQNGITFPQPSAKYEDNTEPVMEPFMMK